MSATGPGQSVLLLLDVAALLGEKGIDYAAIGALAASVYGTVRATVDADAIVSVPRAKLGDLEKSLRKSGFKADLRRGDPEDPIPALLAISDRHGNRVDLIAGLRGLDPEAFGRAITLTLSGSPLRIIGREDFISMKCFAGGPQDLADADEAYRSANAPIDIDLVRRLARRFGRPAADALERVLCA